MPRETEKHSLIHLKIGGKQIGGPSPGEREITRTLKEVWRYSLKMVMEWWVFCSLTLCGRGRTHRGSHPRSSNDCVCDGGVHTLVARTFFWCTYTARTLRTFLCVLLTCKAQGSRVSAVRMSSSHLHPSHVSPVLAPAVPWRSLRDLSRPRRPHWRFCPRDPAELPRPKGAGQAHSARGRGVWLSGQVRCKHRKWAQKSLTRILPWMMTRRPSTMRITIPLTSRKPRTRTQANSVFTQRLNPLFCTFLIGDLVPQRESKESMQSGNRCWTERRFCDQCCRVDVKERSTERYQCESEESQKILFWRVTKNSTLMNEIFEDTWNEELNKLFLVKIQFRENFTRLSTAWRSKIWNEEIQNMHHSNRNEGLNLKDYNYWKKDVHWTDQVQRERIHFCSELEMKSRLHQRMV